MRGSSRHERLRFRGLLLGLPFEILGACWDGRIQMVVSAEILDEYRWVGERLEAGRSGTAFSQILLLVALHGEVVLTAGLAGPVCEDSTEDKFFACAIGAECSAIVSGDRHLHRANGYGGVKVYRPREFVERFLAS